MLGSARWGRQLLVHHSRASLLIRQATGQSSHLTRFARRVHARRLQQGLAELPPTLEDVEREVSELDRMLGGINGGNNGPVAMETLTSATNVAKVREHTGRACTMDMNVRSASAQAGKPEGCGGNIDARGDENSGWFSKPHSHPKHIGKVHHRPRGGSRNHVRARPPSRGRVFSGRAVCVQP